MEVQSYSPERRGDFALLNFEWLEKWFTVEDVDREVLEDPKGSIIDQGGQIWFAVNDDGRAVGTVALRSDGDGVYELTKMAVSPETRGQGIGRLLASAAITGFHVLGGEHLYLETNSRLAPAIALYESLGFEHRPMKPDSHYGRADVHMVWTGRTHD